MQCSQVSKDCFQRTFSNNNVHFAIITKHACLLQRDKEDCVPIQVITLILNNYSESNLLDFVNYEVENYRQG